ncbi:MAG: sulfurtransferase [Candidatus Eremiobacteraeota bacterium]|nr:sulfurtransferase [Candidatus Eremiobacteraeota bacterium]
MSFTTIISSQALRERLGDPHLAIFDCRHALADFSLGRRLYDESHIPGAFFAGVEEDLAGAKSGTNGRHPLPEPDTFARFLRACGVNDSTQLVAYDAGGDMFAPRFWFLSRWIGHDAVAVLDGGFAAWTAAGYPVNADPVPAACEGNLTVRLAPDLLVDAQFVLEHLGADDMHLLDARAAERYSGETEPIDPVAGHIPGAKNRWFKENFRADGTLKSPEELRAEYARAGVDPKRTVHQCGSGVSAAVAHFSMHHAGLLGSRIYNGSWSEWVADPKRPVETGS